MAEELEGQTSRSLTPAEKNLQRELSSEGVEVSTLEDGRRMWKLTPALAEKMNLLTPISSVMQVDGNWTPFPRMVKIRAGKDTYKVGWDGQAKQEVHAIEGKALSGLADIAGIEAVTGRTVRHAGGMEVFVTAKMRQPDGTWRFHENSADVDFADHAELIELEALERWEKYNRVAWEKKQAGANLQGQEARDAKPAPTDTDIRRLVLKDKEFLGRKLRSKAYYRCIRELLQIRTMLKDDFNKPFLALSWYMTPDWSREGTRELVRLQYASASSDLFGESPALGAGGSYTETEVMDDATLAAIASEAVREDHAPEPDRDADGDVIDVDPETGEVLGERGSDPDEIHDDGSAEAPGSDFSTSSEVPPEIPRPEIDFGFGDNAAAAQYRGRKISDIVSDEKGYLYVRRRAQGMKTGPQRDLLVEWLRWAKQAEVEWEPES